MKNFFTVKFHLFLALIAILAISLFSNSNSYAQTLASPYVVTTFPTTISNVNTSGGETATGMQGACFTLPCCSVNVVKVTLPSDGVLRVEMIGFTPLAGSIIAYHPTVANPTNYSDLAYISGSPGNFCGFRDTLQLGRAFTDNWDYIPYGGTPTQYSGLTSVYDFNNPSYQSGYFPAGDYYLMVFNQNQQANLGTGTTIDLTFEFAEACAPLTTPTALIFDTLEYNSELDTISFYIKNQRTLDVNIDSSNINITGTNASEFTLLPLSDTTLGVGDSIQLQAIFSPISGGTRTASLQIPFSDTNCTTSSTISLTGYGAQPEIVVLGNNTNINNNDTSPSSNDFTDMGPVVTNTGFVTRQFKITNTGSDTLTFTNNPIVSLSGNSQFIVSSQPASLVLPGDTTSFEITFTPTIDGNVTTDVSIANNDLNESTFTFRIEGTGAERNGLHFDGSNDYVNINSVADDMTGITNWTIESWIKADPSQSGNDHILAVNTTGTGTVFLFRLDDGILDFYDGSTAFKVGPDLRDDIWHHVAATYDNGQLNLFIDGIPQGSFNTGTINFASNNRWSLGQEYDGSSLSEYFKGALNDLRIWKITKTPQEIADNKYCEIQNPPSDANLTGYYTFNQGVSGGSNTSINTITDVSGYANTGIPTNFAFTGAVSNFIAATNVGVNCNSVRVSLCDIDSYTIPGGNTYSTSGVYIDTLTNSIGGDSIVYTDLSIRFFQITQDIINDTTVCDTIKEFVQTPYTPFARFENSDNHWVEINGAVDSLVNTNRSVFLWMREADQVNSSADVLVGINTSGTGTVTNFGINTNEELWIYDGGNNRNSGVVVTDGQWHFVGYTYDEASNQTQFWVDGVAANSFTNGQSISSTSRISLGQEFDGSSPGNFYDGDMAEVTIWNEVLDASDITLLMESSVQTSHPKYNKLKAYYPMISECNNTGLTLKDFGPHAFDGTMTSNDIIITDTLANLPNHNAAPLYNKSWMRNGTQISMSDSLFLTSPLQAGSYSLDLSLDYFNVSDTWNVTVDPSCAGLFASVTVNSNVSCNGFSDGNVTASGINGTAPYIFAWNTGATTASISGLSAGTYTVTVTDGLGDTNSTSISITEPATLNANPIITSNISTTGVSDGIATASPLGGTAPYTYLWSNGATTASISGLSAGTYTVTVTDSNSCMNNGSVTFIAPVAPTPGVIVITEINYNPPEAGIDSTEYIEIYNTSSSPVNLLGCKFTSGIDYTFPNVSINAGGYILIALDSISMLNRFGVTAYQWSFGGLSNGGEPIALKDASDNLIDSLRYDDVAPWPTSPDGTGTTLVLCDPGADNTNGINWSASSTILSGLIIDGKQVYGSPGAEDDTCMVTGIIASVIGNTNVSCNGFHDGGATATATGGTTPYTYLWNNGVTNTSITGVAAGTYSVTITDNNGSTDSASVTITEPTALISSASITSTIDCNGATNGQVTASATGGTTPYTYSWNTGETNALETNLGASTYSVTITDHNGCTDSASVIIIEPATLTASASTIADVSQNGLSDGSVSTSATGGTTPYTYTWNTGATTITVSNLSASTYSVTITDQNGCTDSASTVVSVLPSFSANTPSSSNISCNGLSDGSATATQTGGSSPYSYLWSNGSTNASINNLTSGTYTVTITENGGLTDTSSVTITEPSALTSSASITSAIDCNSATNGQVTASATGGTGAYTYSWNTGGTSALETGLGAATYSVTITDYNGCTDSTSVTITEPSALTTLTIVDSNITCNGFANGGATTSASGGSMPYSYTWSNGATNASITGVIAGTYSITVTDNNGCTDSTSVIITEPSLSVVTAIADSNISCNGLSDGGATATANGGTAPYSYTWSNSATNAYITGISAGNYSVTITDNNGCTDSTSISISEPSLFIANAVTDSNISCNGLSDGGATANANGGTTPYSYTWSNSATNASITGISAGNYSVTITDNNGCTDSTSISISEPTLLITTTIVDSNVTCNGFANGGATTSASGGSMPYSYTWSNGATNASITGVIAGTYSITVTDNNGCTDSTSVIITEPSLSVVTAMADSNISCSGLSDGGATATANGGTTPYSYTWSNGATNASITGIPGGTYSVTITDNSGCTDSTSVIITEPSLFIANVVTDSNISCNGLSDGGATANANGGTTPYSYTWSNSATNASITGIAAGNYSVTITDNNGCTDSTSIFISEPTLLITTTIVDSNATCSGTMNGGATVSASGGTGGYSYGWSNSAITASITGVIANTYTVTITDANGCSNIDTINIMVEDTIRPVVITQNIDVYLDINGNSTITTANIDNGSSDACGIQSMQLDITSFDCSNIGPNTVELLVTDANGNSDSTTAVVTVIDSLAPAINGQNINAYLNSSGQVSITASDIDNGSVDNCGIASTTISNSNFTCAEIGPNNVDLIVEDVNGNIDTVTYIVTILDTVSPVVNTSNTTVYLDASGQASITVTDIDNNSTDNCGIQTMTLDSVNFDCSEIGVNTVVLTVSDFNGNSSTQSATVTVVDTNSPIVVTQNYTAYLDATGSITISENNIDNGSSDNCGIQSMTLDQYTFTCADTGSNTVILEVYDLNGNNNTASAVVTILDTLKPTVISQDINAYLDVNGQVSISASDIDNGSTDNCTIQNMTLDNSSFDCSAVGVNTVILSVTDINGNTDTASATVTVIDSISPVVSTQDITIYLDASGISNITTSDIDNGSIDNCAIQSQSLDISTFNCNDLGTNTVTLSVTDVNGNTNTQTAIVTLVDSITPKITCPASFSNCGPEITVDDPVVSDNCSITLQLVSGIASGETFPVGKTTNTYEVTDISGNKATCSVDITRFPQPVVTVRDDSTVYYAQSLTLYAQSEFVVEYQWSPAIYLNNSTIQQPICTPRETTEYTLIGKSADGCYSEPKSVYITVYEGGELLIPNTFSPNGDGYNDYFEIPGIAFLPEMRMTIFNRNGEILYQKKGYQNDWDGTSNGKVLPVATYYYVIDLGNNQEPIKGDITIIK